MVIEHLGKDLQHGSIVLIAEAFDIDIEKNCLRRSLCRLVNEHEGRRIICEFLPEPLDGRNSIDCPVFQNIREHLQEVRFTTSKETGYPDADI